MKNPKWISEYLLGEGVTRQDTDSFESIFARINTKYFPHKDKIDNILEKFISILKRKKLPLPEELEMENEISITESFSDYENLSSVCNMQKIPHILNMSIKGMLEFFDGSPIEVSEKLDGSNFSVGVVNGKVFGKSKKDKAKINPEYFYDNKDIDTVYIAMGNLIKMLNEFNFFEWHDSICERMKIKSIQFFGEIFYSGQPNTIKYDDKKIGGRGTFVVFGVSIDGVDISNTDNGIKFMEQFANKFSNFTFNILTKNLYDCDIDFSKVSRLTNYISINKKLLTSKTSSDLKDDAIKVYKRLVNEVKNQYINFSQTQKSMLGADEIEGLVLRNLSNNRVMKIVDIEKFSYINSKNWSDRDELKIHRRSLIELLISECFEGCDILLLKDKQINIINDYLVISKSEIETENGLLLILLDAIREECNINIHMIRAVLYEYLSKLNYLYDNIDKTVDTKNW